MSDEPEWFTPKRYGYGSGLPIRWQGWALMLGFIAFATFLSARLAGQPLKLFALLTPLTIVLMVIAAKTTRGGWRWRWGKDDD
jgi:hypothetical protein